MFGSDGGGSRLCIPMSVLIEDVNKKKVSNKNEMSDMDELLSAGNFFFPLAILLQFFCYFRIYSSQNYACKQYIHGVHARSDKFGT